MYKKIYDFYDKLRNLKKWIYFTLILTLIFLTYFCITISFKKGWEDFFSYPENEYIELEKEAKDIIKSGNFETDFDLTITNYDNNSNQLQMEIKNDSSTLSITINNYGKTNQEVIFNRKYETSNKYIFNNILSLLSLSMILSLIVILSIAILLLLIFVITLILEKITKKIKHKT